MRNIIVGIPTVDSASYIHLNLDKYKNEFKVINEIFKLTIYVCINDEKNNHSTIQTVEKFMKNNEEFDIRLIKCIEKGKNIALNEILKYAAEDDIIQFLDDDIEFELGAVLNNIVYLIALKQKYGMNYPILVGSELYAKEKSFKSYRSTNLSKIISLKKYMYYRIFSLPFNKETENPTFCMGGSLCFFRGDFTYYPEDNNIADDGFIGNYFAIEGKDFYEKYKVSNIFKCINSKGYFSVADNYQEWLMQQIRVFTGVYYSYEYFSGNNEYFAEIFSWKYSITKDFRSKYKEKNVLNKILLVILRNFQKKILKESFKLIDSRKEVKWHSIMTTKT